MMRFRLARLGHAALALLALCAALPACGGPALPQAAPFAAPGVLASGRWTLLEGGEVDLEHLRGKPLVIHLFTTWSLPAQFDVEELRRVQDALGRDTFTVLGLGLDKDGRALLLPYRDAAAIVWPLALPSEDVVAGKSFLGDVMAAVPSTVLVNAQGKVAWTHRGPLVAGQLEAQLTTLGLRR